MKNNSIICGGWRIDPVLCSDSKMEKRLMEGFKKAFDGWCGLNFEPLLYCGLQLVAGTNHMFICKGTDNTGGKNEIKTVAAVTLHETLAAVGKSDVVFSVMDIETLATNVHPDGGWNIEITSEIDAEIEKGLESAMVVGAGYTPLLQCATSASTKNPHYLLICKGRLSTLADNIMISAVVLSKPVEEGGKWCVLSADNIIDPVFGGSTGNETLSYCMRPGEVSGYHVLTAKDSDIFEKAKKGLIGVGYRPFAVSTQVINGLMRVYLCEATVMNASFDRFLANVYVAELFDGSIKLEKVVSLTEAGQEKI